jgi:hypothetical protein
VLAAERHAALREAFAHLPPCCQQLIALLIKDPPVPYAEISARLGIPTRGIGPNRRLLRATFTEGLPIADKPTLVRLATEAGLPRRAGTGRPRWGRLR